ncbi:hypothetical protein J7337_000581 [Fusarium musae]|uniref:Uncharacterized protein n=1 Tax=Fusarium musae TaxID=1042133 RepID=A0A9P8DS68_9HYPO|nr:hypothetical protein J7337_000581 [Fusarium musae]KAG9507033.1 hypothetical protein J7337_000581 [Fusarium musae]
MSAQDYYGGGGGGGYPQHPQPVNTALPKASMALPRDSMVPLKGNITVHPKANLPCNINKHPLNKVVASAAAAAA